MATGAAGRRSLIKPISIGIATLLATLILLAGAWLLWTFVLSPKPAGFAPTTGEASGAGDQQTAVLQYTIDARSRENWVYFSFANGMDLSTSMEAMDWDLAFRRNDVLTNGGESNPLGMGGAVDLGEVSLVEAVAPSEGYLTDKVDDERGLENPALHKWYNYNWTTHIITSKGHTYALRTHSGDVVLLTFLSYYCDDGSSGCVTFQYSRPTGR
jgi:hypothetical protein